MSKADLIFNGMVFETGIILIAFVILILVFLKLRKKRQKLTLYLFLIFLCMTISIIFSWLSKVLQLYSGLDYLMDDLVPDPGTLTSWILLRITEFRFTFVFLMIAIFISYVLKVNLFEKEYNKVQRIFVILYGTIGTLFIFLVFFKGELIYDLIAFLIVSAYMFMIYFPFMKSCLSASKEVEEKKYKMAFYSLMIMAISFILILICQSIDRVLIIVQDIVGYTVFYYAGWTFAIISLIGAYLGYIRPKSQE
ncbi:MAG: hypothetical protein JXA99_09390 [Candidatus Lokiarchaeota archaeon]|nr:hypothetical protein [Candidatus Lokiarchaeota archaeon]